MLLRSRLVRPLEDSYQAVLDGIARARGWPTTAEPARLASLVRGLSEAYNGEHAAPLRTDEALAARLGFSFARDAPKGAGAVRELVATGALAMPAGRPLRVLDLGSGLGATSRGVVRALAAFGAKGEVLVDALDDDGEALQLAPTIARAVPCEGAIGVTLRTFRASATATLPVRGPFDLVLFGQLLSELDRDLGSGRTSKHADLIRARAKDLTPDGSLVVVEPALRERTRHLHAVRDELVASDSRPSELNVFAPCVHDSPCPMRPAPDAWCHEDLDVDLPSWLVPVARVAGLRWQGLTFSYLVLRRDGSRYSRYPSTGDASKGGSSRILRVVSAPLVTKGKHELYLCGPFDREEEGARLKVTRLDRHRSLANQAWDRAVRGDVLELTGPLPADRPRVIDSTSVVRRSM